MSEDNQSQPVNFQQLADEATRQLHQDILASPWCRFKIHQWTKWQIDNTSTQTRICLGCGKTQWIIPKVHTHNWKTEAWGHIVKSDSDSSLPRELRTPTGKYFDQTCTSCGDKRRTKIYT